MEEIIKERQEKIIEKLNLKKNWYWFVLTAIAWLGYWIRTRNLNLLIDITTGKYFPADPDASAFLRYIKYIFENGSLMSVDYMRYYPWGYDNMIEFKFLSYVIVYLHKFLHFFNPALTIEKADIIYPAIAFVIGLIFFFLLVKKLFDFKVALISSLFLTIIPMYLFRTIAGVGDKEAFAMILFFATLYFFICGWENKNVKKIVLFGVIAGFINGLMGLVWGGMYFVIMIISIFSIISLFLVKFRTNNFIAYSSWLISFVLTLTTLRETITIKGLLAGIYSGFAMFTFLCGIIYYVLFKKDLLKIKNKVKDKIPLGISSILIGVFIGVLGYLAIVGHSVLYHNIREIYSIFTNPFGQSRWALTVAENHQPYFIEWISHTSWKFIWMFLIGSVFLFYEMCGNFLNKRNKIIGTGLYIFMLFGLIFNRYSQTSVLNGESDISRLFYFGSLILFSISLIWYYFSTFKKNKELFKEKASINEHYLLLLIWFFVMLVGARSAVRILFVLAPVICVLAGFLVIRLFDISLKKKNLYKYVAWVLLVLLLINPFSFSSFAYGILDIGVVNNFYERTLTQAKNTGTGYNSQWQVAGQWVRENIPNDAVFAHWWDYGYWVQTGFGRATVTDGGNAKGSLNHMMGRHVLTGQNEIEALEFLKAHEVTNLLIVSDEIGKYPAFSSIGADENWDRYSWINVFTRDDTKTRESREGTVYIFTGGTPLDSDFEYNGKLYPKGGSGIIAIMISTIGNEGGVTFAQPQVVLVYNGQQEIAPLECLFFNGREMIFKEKGVKGCFVIIPKIDGTVADGLGNGLYISERVKNTLFYKLYLTGQEGKYFKLVYNDEANIPLSVFNGRIIGPLKIWEVSYPENLEVPEIYYRDELPNPKVSSIEGRY